MKPVLGSEILRDMNLQIGLSEDLLSDHDKNLVRAHQTKINTALQFLDHAIGNLKYADDDNLLDAVESLKNARAAIIEYNQAVAEMGRH